MPSALLYSDQGAGEDLANLLFLELKKTFHIERISAKELIETSKIEKANLFIIPGGRDLPYVKLLHGKGTEKIRSFIENGGSFLGICAGAYFASSYVEFDKGGPLHIEGARELQLFPGKAIGPLFGPYVYNSEKSARIVPITFHDSQGHFQAYSYYNGGCFFEQNNAPHVDILATYKNGLSAIVRCRRGRGIAILSGVHFEKPLFHASFERGRRNLVSRITTLLSEGGSR